jgi:hypothetical protein
MHSYLGDPKKKTIHKKTKTVAAGYARRNSFGFFISCKSLKVIFDQTNQ